MRLPKYLKKKIKMQTRQSPNRETLVRLAVRVGIPEANQMSKTALYDRLNSECNFERLMRAEIRRSCKEAKSRKRKRSRERSKRTSKLAEMADSEAKRIKLNKIDPIMLAPIGKKETFKFSRPNGTKVQFNVDTLVDYLLTSGDFHDPETRLPFSDDDLREIDRIAQSNGYAKASVYDARQNATLFSEAKFRRDALLALERCAGEVISEILEVVETFEPEDAQMELVTQQFPIFQDYYRQMKKADHSYASKCLAHWNAFIKGPPNHPNDDEYGFIRIVINFLKACENEPISA